MSKYFIFVLLSLLAFVLFAAPAFAGTTVVNHITAGANYTAALEVMGAARNVSLNFGAVNAQAATVPVGYTLGQALSTGNLIQVTLTGAAFQNTNYAICAGNAAGSSATSNAPIATLTSSGNATTQNFQIGALNGNNGVSAGNVIWLTNDTTCNSGVAAPNFPVMLTTQSGTGTATIAIGIVTAGGITVDSTSTKTLATFAKEYAATLSTADTITIDYLGTPGNGTQLAAFGGDGNKTTAGSANKLVVVQTPQDLDAQNALPFPGSVTVAMAMNATLTVSDQLGFAGINAVYITASNVATVAVNSPACTPAAAANLASNATVAASGGNITLTVPAATWVGGGNLGVGVCLSTNGTVLQTRTINGTYQVAVPTGGVQTIPASTSAAWQNWGLNGYQALLPWLTQTGTFGVNNSAPTYCLVNNAASSTGTMFLDVLSTDNSTSVMGLTIGTIPATTSLMLVFDANGVEVAGVLNTVTGNPVTAAQFPSFGTSVGKRYVGRLTVAAPQNMVSVTCQQTDAVTGSKRLLPVLVNNTNAYSWAF